SLYDALPILNDPLIVLGQHQEVGDRGPHIVGDDPDEVLELGVLLQDLVVGQGLLGDIVAGTGHPEGSSVDVVIVPSLLVYVPDLPSLEYDPVDDIMGDPVQDAIADIAVEGFPVLWMDDIQ